MGEAPQRLDVQLNTGASFSPPFRRFPGAPGSGSSETESSIQPSSAWAITESRQRGSNRDGARVHLVEVPDVRAIRRGPHTTRREFGDGFHTPLATLKNREQRSRSPGAPAAGYPQTIARRPWTIRETLNLGRVSRYQSSFHVHEDS
jgi:putative transcriptional regulator